MNEPADIPDESDDAPGPDESSASEPPAAGDAGKRQEQYTGLATDAAKRLSSAALVWAVALVVTFQLVDSEVSKRLESIRSAVSDERSLSDQIDSTKGANRAALRRKLNDRRAANAELAKPIDISLPGLSKMTILPPLAPVGWLALSLLVLLHLFNMRRHAHGYLALAIRLTAPKYRGVPVAVPYRAVLAPLPSRNGDGVSAEELAAAYGTTSGAHSRWWLWAAATLLLAAQLRMLFVQYTLSIYLQPAGLRWLLEGLSLAIASATALLCWRWIQDWRVPDADFLPHGQHRRQRRELLALLATGAGAVVGGALVTRYGGPVGARVKTIARPLLALTRSSPRYPRRAKRLGMAVQLPDGPAVLATTRVIHLVWGGRLADASVPPTLARQLKTVSGHQLAQELRRGPVRLNPPLASAIVEAALRASSRRPAPGPTLAQGDQLKLLMEAIRSDLLFKRGSGRVVEGAVPRVAIHLYDRFAAAAVGGGNLGQLDQLTAFMRSQGLSEFYAARVAKWTDEQSKWRRGLAERMQMKA